MTKLLKQVFAEIEKLPDDAQDRIAAELISYLSGATDDDLRLSDEQVAELRRRRADPNPQRLQLEEVEARLRRLGA
jgi:hypothetical protein